MESKYRYIIIGSGIIGLATAKALKQKHPESSVLIIEKEGEVAAHASSRNSGVLHAGFYYTADSLKAKFTVDGNREMKQYCRERSLPLNEAGKIVVAQNDEDIEVLYELEKRGKANGSNVKIIDEYQAADIDPNVKTRKKALYSPDTASVNPLQVCKCLYKELTEINVNFMFKAKYLGHDGNTIQTQKGDFNGEKIINCAGLYADKVAQDFGFGYQYSMIPFKGIYLKYTKNTTDVKTNIYPVPNIKNPFLGVHFTKTVTDEIKIGPTAIPAFWRENYKGFERFNLGEFLSIAASESKLMLTNSFGFRNLAFEEMRKYSKSHFIKLASNMVQSIDPEGFTKFTEPGIRAQLLDRTQSKLVQDFVVEADEHSIHVLNAVSPAFTCAFPFARFLVESYVK